MKLVPTILLASAAAACAGTDSRETASLIDDVDRYRHADSASKAAQTRAVAAAACSSTAVCEAKRVCIEAMDPTTRALAIKDEVTARLADIEQKRLDASSAEARALPGKLDEAARLLDAGRAKMTECERRLADLRAQYGG